MSETTIRDLLACPHCELRDKHTIAQEYYINLLNRMDRMFKYEGLPDTIPDYILNRYLFVNGWCGIGRAPLTAQEHAGELVCFFGGLGAKPDLYYQPTKIILANPVLGTKEYTIGEDVVWAKNDNCTQGISHILSRYAHLLAENDISINIAQVTTRMPFVLTAETEAEKLSAEEFIKQAEQGKVGIVKSSISMNNGFRSLTTTGDSSGNYIKALIELHQYLKAQCNNDLGIGSNFNMKRERMSVAEVENNSPYLLPLVDEMLHFREKMCEEVNAMFGTNWSVSLDSAWELEDTQQTLEVENLDNSSQLENERSDEDADVQRDVSELTD